MIRIALSEKGKRLFVMITDMFDTILSIDEFRYDFDDDEWISEIENFIDGMSLMRKDEIAKKLRGIYCE